MTNPYEISFVWLGNSGVNAVAIVSPSGLTRARYSPPAASAKLVCNGRPGVARFLPEAKTTKKEPRARFMEGNCHFTRFVRLSVRYQPRRSTGPVPALKISIQSE